MTTAKKLGRPSGYSLAMAGKICLRLEKGESLLAMCKEAGMPTRTTVHRWLDDNEQFRGMYARARDKGLDALAEELLEIADTPMVGTKTVDKPTGREISKGDMIEHRRLQIDTRKWYLSKLAPKRYGDRLNVEGKVELDIGDRLERALQAVGKA